MGNFFQRLFSSDSAKSAETSCKRPFNKSKLSGSKKSQTSPAQLTHATTNHENDSSPSTPPEEQVETREKSPFQRDFLPPHQPLVSLEKARPRRSNIRRSSRMNSSVGKGDNAERPHKNVLATVPSYIEPDYDDDNPNVVSNRADPTVPVSRSNHTSTYWAHNEEEETEEKVETESSNHETVDELSPNERHKVAKSRISQMFVKREQRQQPHSMMIDPSEVAHANSSNSTSNGGMVLSSDYVRVYENIDNYGHYAAVHERHESEHKSTPNSSRDMSEDDEPKASDNDELDTNDHHPNQPDESFRAEAAVPRRKMMHGNPLLIDELKKRQSTLYQATN